jgi:hypothetical protein
MEGNDTKNNTSAPEYDSISVDGSYRLPLRISIPVSRTAAGIASVLEDEIRSPEISTSFSVRRVWSAMRPRPPVEPGDPGYSLFEREHSIDFHTCKNNHD